jgi:integrase
MECPQCGSNKFWKDGLRYDSCSNVAIQRYLCRACGFRFSDPSIKLNVTSQILKVSNPGKNHANRGITRPNFSREEVVDGFSFNGSEDIGAHNVTIIEKRLNPLRIYNSEYRVGATSRGAKNLDTAIETKAVGESPKTEQDAKGLILQYAWKMKKQGQAETTIETRIYRLNKLVQKGANLMNPDSVETVLATEKWTQANKRFFVMAYLSFTRAFNIVWKPIKTHYEPRQVFIPLEKEIDSLISGCGKTTSTFLQTLKDTGARAGEGCKLKWIDVNCENNTISINNPEKGSHSRTIKVSTKTIAMINALPKKSEYIFTPNVRALQSTFARSRKRLARTLQNPRLLQIHFHTLRHFKGTMEYSRTKNILWVKQLLGHKRIENTEVYTHLVNFEDEEYHSATAEKVEEAKQLIEKGFEYVCDMEGIKLFRKRK